MFQLIVTVISIALIAALAVASIFYGGAAFSGSSAKAAETTLINGGQQIAGAVALYRTNSSGQNPSTSAGTITVAGSILTSATPAYLQASPTPPTGVPTGSAWQIVTAASGQEYAALQIDNSATTPTAGSAPSNATCARAEVDNGQAGVYNETNVATVATLALSVTGVQFDCVYDTAAGATQGFYFVYKL